MIFTYLLSVKIYNKILFRNLKLVLSTLLTNYASGQNFACQNYHNTINPFQKTGKRIETRRHYLLFEWKKVPISQYCVPITLNSGSAGPRAALYTATCDTCPDKTPRTNYGMMRRISVCSICGKYLDDWQRSTPQQETQTYFRPALDL